MADVPLIFAILRRRRLSAWLAALALIGAVTAALISGQQQVISVLPALVVAGFYFALYRGSTLRDRASELAADRAAAAPVQPKHNSDATVHATERLLRQARSALTALIPTRAADKADAEVGGRLSLMAAAERRREAARQSRSRT